MHGHDALDPAPTQGSAPAPDTDPRAVPARRDQGTGGERTAHGEASAGTPAAAERPAPVPARRSPYARMGENTSVRNVVWALGLTVGVVAIVATLFFGVGSTPDRHIPENSRVDVAQSAARAQELAPFPVAVPRLGEEWRAQQARYDDRTDPRWTIRYSAPSGELLTLTQAGTLSPALIQDSLPGARSEGTAKVRGIACEVYAGGDEGGARALACPGDGWGMVVSGTTDRAELTEMADAAIASTES